MPLHPSLLKRHTGARDLGSLLVAYAYHPGPGWVFGRIGRVPGGPLHFWAGREFYFLTFVTLVHLLKYSIHVPHSDTAASAWVVPCEGVLPSQIELVGSITFLRLPIAGPALPQRYASERMDGRKRG